MIAKISYGSGFRGALNYLLEREHDPERIGGNMAGRDAGELAREFGIMRAGRRDVEQAVHHVSLSWSPEEKLSDERMVKATERYLGEMGYKLERHQYVLIRHRDKEHPHAHVVVNRVSIDGELRQKPGWEYKQNREVCRTIEREMGFRQVRPREHEQERERERGGYWMERERHERPEKEQLRRDIRDAARGRPTMGRFVERLEERGIQVQVNQARTGHISGISYRLDRIAVRGSGLGREYSWQGIQKTLGVRYESERDGAVLERAATRAIRPPREPLRRDVGRALERALGRVVARELTRRLLPVPVRIGLGVARAIVREDHGRGIER